MAYHKIDVNEAQVGDFVKYFEDNLMYSTRADVFYAITMIGTAGDFEFIDDAGDRNIAIPSMEHFEVYREVDL